MARQVFLNRDEAPCAFHQHDWRGCLVDTRQYLTADFGEGGIVRARYWQKSEAGRLEPVEVLMPVLTDGQVDARFPCPCGDDTARAMCQEALPAYVVLCLQEFVAQCRDGRHQPHNYYA